MKFVLLALMLIGFAAPAVVIFTSGKSYDGLAAPCFILPAGLTLQAIILTLFMNRRRKL
jgi:hypothetical protein